MKADNKGKAKMVPMATHHFNLPIEDVEKLMRRAAARAGWVGVNRDILVFADDDEKRRVCVSPRSDDACRIAKEAGDTVIEYLLHDGLPPHCKKVCMLVGPFDGDWGYLFNLHTILGIAELGLSAEHEGIIAYDLCNRADIELLAKPVEIYRGVLFDWLLLQGDDWQS